MDGFVLRMRIGLDVGAGAMAKPDDVTGHAAHFGGYLAGWAVGKGFKPRKTWHALKFL